MRLTTAHVEPTRLVVIGSNTHLSDQTDKAAIQRANRLTGVVICVLNA